MRRKVTLLLLLPFAAAFATFIVLISPVRRVRLGLIGSARIGHFITAVEVYLSKKRAAIAPDPIGCIDVFCFEKVVCNDEIANQWRRRLHVFPFPRIGHLSIRLLGMQRWLSRRHLIPKSELSPWGAATESAIHRFRGHLSVPVEAIKQMQYLLRSVGGRHPFVCVHARDSNYLRVTQPGIDYSYHDYRDWDPNTLLPTLFELAKRGYFTLRMGAHVNSSISAPSEAFYDYARSGQRNDAMDLALSAHCELWIGSASGLLDVPFVFRRPLVVVNHVSPLLDDDPRMTHYENSVWILKKFYSEKEERFLSYREVVSSGIGRYSSGPQFSSAGIRLVDNTADEIRDAALEMVGRIQGSWRQTAEDDELQGRFWAIWGPDTRVRAERAGVRIGSRFLAENIELVR